MLELTFIPVEFYLVSVDLMLPPVKIFYIVCQVTDFAYLTTSFFMSKYLKTGDF